MTPHGENSIATQVRDQVPGHRKPVARQAALRAGEGMPTMDVSTIEDLRLDGTHKGMPPGASAIRLGDIGSRGWNVLHGELPFPLATLSRRALENNQRWMSAFLSQSGTRLAPHGKTTMAPQLFAMQLQGGCWGITVATIQQVAVCRRFGVERVLMANQLTSTLAIDFVLSELDRDPAFDFYCLVDNLCGVERLASRSARRAGRPLQVLLEIGFEGGRTGCRSADEAMTIARAVAEPGNGLVLAGLETYEGLFVSDDADRDAEAVDTLLGKVLDVAERSEAEQLFGRSPALLSAGGSAYYDLVAQRLSSFAEGARFQIVARSGCYLTHDSALYDRHFERVRHRVPGLQGVSGGLTPALTVWSEVQSCPEPGLAILTMGKRDVSFDAGMPVPRWRVRTQSDHVQPLQRAEVSALDDQHAYLRLPEDQEIAVGDLVGCGISHPCTTFDKWELLFVVDDEWSVIGAIKTYF